MKLNDVHTFSKTDQAVVKHSASDLQIDFSKAYN